MLSPDLAPPSTNRRVLGVVYTAVVYGRQLAPLLRGLPLHLASYAISHGTGPARNKEVAQASCRSTCLRLETHALAGLHEARHWDPEAPALCHTATTADWP